MSRPDSNGSKMHRYRQQTVRLASILWQQFHAPLYEDDQCVVKNTRGSFPSNSDPRK